MSCYANSTVNTTDQTSEENLVSPLLMYRTFAVLLVFTMVVGSLGNILVIVTILKSNRFRVPTYAFLLQVAIINVLFQTVVVPINIYSFMETLWTPSTVLCIMIIDVTHMCLCTSNILLMFVSAYRCVLVCYNNIYTIIKSPKVVISLCVCVWVETILMTLVFGKKVNFSRKIMTCVFAIMHQHFFLLVFLCLPMSLLSIAMYIKSVVFIKNAQRRVSPQGSDSSRNLSNSHKLTKIAALISVNHLVTVLLPGIFNTLVPADHTMKTNIVVVVLFLARLTAAVDFIIYIRNDKTFRSMIMNIFKSSRCIYTPRDTQFQQGEANINRF
ncbi:hypothetical protein ACJMK2_029385 [Sinanodonta woodiana]|uniref:G-protein coupled receptors family 1 profile domain-containing protein n=1 Tax=Sinanodonta woodiana TaxID=1069815 RepID=A0ABD3XAJ4_SINWO